jgi:hypothetical protein
LVRETKGWFSSACREPRAAAVVAVVRPLKLFFMAAAFTSEKSFGGFDFGFRFKRDA